MPAWLEPFARIHPITPAADAVRVLSLGLPAATPAWKSLACIAGILVVFVPLGVNRYRRII